MFLPEWNKITVSPENGQVFIHTQNFDDEFEKKMIKFHGLMSNLKTWHQHGHLRPWKLLTDITLFHFKSTVTILCIQLVQKARYCISLTHSCQWCKNKAMLSVKLTLGKWTIMFSVVLSAMFNTRYLKGICNRRSKFCTYILKRTT